MMVVLPHAARALLETAFPSAAIHSVAPTVGGFSNLTLALTLGDRRCVAKIATRSTKRDDLRREAAALTWLATHAPQQQGLGRAHVPALLALLEDETTTVELLAHLPGTPGITLYDGGIPTFILPFSTLCIRLAALHRYPAPTEPVLAAGIEIARGTPVLDDPQLNPDLRRAFAAALERVADRPQTCFTHGDPGLHNVLASPDDTDLSGLLDWEWAAAGEPARDLAWLRWTLHWRGFGQLDELNVYRVYRRDSLAMIDAHVEPALLDAYALARIAAIMGGLEPHARGEWIRRAEWTLARWRIAAG